MLVYSKGTTGTPIVETNLYTPSGYSGLENPEIAVTDTGVAAIAWMSQKNGTWPTEYATFYYLNTEPGTTSEVDPGYNACDIHLVSKGNSIYAVNARFGTPPGPSVDYDVVKVSK